MKTALRSVALVLLILIIGLGRVLATSNKLDFLSATVNCNAATTLIAGVDFNSQIISVKWSRWIPAIAAISITFTRTAGLASEVDFEFQASVDDGESWTTAYFLKISIATNETAVNDVVRVVKLIQFWGITHLRLSRIKNNDASNNLTACNAAFSF